MKKFEIPYKLKANQYFKLAKATGWDAHTGKTINYRESIGKVVSVPCAISDPEQIQLCSQTVIHATKDPLYWLSNVGLPCSLFVVEGEEVIHDDEKAGFQKFKIVKEIPASQFDKLFGFKYSEAVAPFDPRKVTPPLKVDDRIMKELKIWDSVWGSVRGSVRDSVWGSVRDSVWGSVRDSVRGSVWGSVRDSVRGSVRDSVRDSVWDSVWDSEAAYIGTLFSTVTEWKYIKHAPGEYPFQSCVNLLKLGLVPAYNSYDKIWYLCHPKKDSKADILWQGPLELARSVK